jgi:hypothetical protein
MMLELPGFGPPYDPEEAALKAAHFTSRLDALAHQLDQATLPPVERCRLLIAMAEVRETATHLMSAMALSRNERPTGPSKPGQAA